MGLASYHLENGGHLFAGHCAEYSFGTGDFTVEAWVRTLAGGTVVGKKGIDDGPGEGGFWLVARPDGTIGFVTGDGRGTFRFDSVATAVCDGVWHHVAAVRQGTTIALYLDGVALDGSSSGDALPPLNVDNPQRLTFGILDRQQEQYREFAGSLAEVRLWNRARAAQEIVAALGTSLPPGTAGLAGYWPLEGGQPLDFTSTRNTAHPEGVVAPSTDAPPLGPGDAPPMLFLFAGRYDAAAREQGGWSPASGLRLTGAGYVIQGDQVLVGAVIDGNTVTWPAEGNLTQGSVTFVLSGSDAAYWADDPQSRYCFQGWFRSAGGARVDYRGVLMPQRTGCGMLLNIGSGEILYTPDDRPGAPVTLAPKTVEVNEHYCLYDDSRILQMRSGLAISVQGDRIPGTEVVLDELGADPKGQSWTFGGDGVIRPVGSPNLALAVDHVPVPARLVLAVSRHTDPAQQFVTLSNPQFIWNGRQSQILASGGAGYMQVRAVPKADDAPAELWYRVRSNLVNAANGAALAVSGRAAPGATLTMAKLNPGSAAQDFVFDQGRLLHASSHLPVKMSRDGVLVLGRSDEHQTECHWTMAPYRPTAAGARAVPEVAAAKTIEYTVRFYTADSYFSGTDDKVEIALVGDAGSSKYVELKKSRTHSDPFESGNMDEFKVTLANVGAIHGINVRYGGGNWLWNDNWLVDAVQVYDPSAAATYYQAPKGAGTQIVMPSQIYIQLPYPVASGADSTMSVGKAPTQDEMTRGWADHTWNRVRGSGLTTFFDNGGGHEGPGTTQDVITSHCSLHTAVKMATRYGIDAEHPYQPVYGHNDVNGVQTCGIRSSGRINRDGQCHQMSNRLLYICEPMVTLDDAPHEKKPTGYGFTVLLFGRYGLGFAEWCQINDFRPPFQSSAALFDFVRRAVKDGPQAIKIAYHAITLRAEYLDRMEEMYGPAAHRFFAAVKDEGISNKTMSDLVDLPEDKIVEEQRPYRPSVPA
ncbi:LamG-like jellyroll fold domain-containing protein [Actinomadura hibisca]|uniref:LamG-like jellyroll fold domain-containing protein n=1 Tax=Actinomadura hibisca TaxID=68565 RepID=UPI00082BE203|nr:LamG-like jellyroll fold domain-containing protein [Actinomadura hibisca]